MQGPSGEATNSVRRQREQGTGRRQGQSTFPGSFSEKEWTKAE